MRESEERFELALRGADAGTWDWDLRTNKVHYGPRWKSMLGYAEDEITDDYLEWETRIHSDDRDHALATVRDYLEGRTASYELEHRLRHVDGTYRSILAQGAAVRGRDGKPYRMVGWHIDITERNRAAEKAKNDELQMMAAQKIQAGLLPSRPPNLAGLDIAGKSFPAEITCGDTFDYLAMRDGCLGLVIGNVSGHGFAPSLLMATTHAYFRSLVLSSADVGEILTLANGILCNEIPDELFITLLFGRLDPRDWSFVYCNAGHPSGYLLDACGTVKSCLESTTLPLGILPDDVFRPSGRLLIEPGDLLLLVTDGVLEAESPEGTHFGIQRMLKTVRDCRAQKSREIIESLYRAVHDFSHRERPVDDVTVVVVKADAEGLQSR